MTWERYIGADRRSAEYNRYLADGIIRNLAASKSRDKSAHSIGPVGEASVWSILLLGNDFDNKGFDRVAFHVGKALSGLTISGRRIASATVTGAGGVTEPVRADWYVSAIPCESSPASSPRTSCPPIPGWPMWRGCAPNG